MSDTTEKEAIERFSESLYEAADAVLKLQYPSKHPFSSAMFLKAMTGASGSANQLAVMQDNPDFHGIRDSIEMLGRTIQVMAVNNHFGIEPKRINGKNPFEHIHGLLKSIAENGKRIATSKPMARDVALEAVDVKEKLMGKFSNEQAKGASNA